MTGVVTATTASVKVEKVAVYCRVSTDEQRERQTIENQVERATLHCQSKGLPIFDVYRDDGVTGTVPLVDRPEGKRLVEDARQGKFQTVIIKQVDRLGRDALHILNAVAQLESLNVKVISILEAMDLTTPQGRFMLTMYSGVAALERDTIIQRSIEGTNRLAREGVHLGGIAPYGYRQVGKGRASRLQPSEELIDSIGISEAEVIRSIYYWIVEERQSTYAIADRLNATSIPPAYIRDQREVLDGKRKSATSGIWRPSRVGNLIKNPTYKGVHYFGRRSKRPRDLIERQVPAIVSAETWDQAQTVLKQNQRFSRKNAKHQYLLRGLMKCGLCGLTLNGTTHSRYKNRMYYICNGKKQARGIYGLHGERCPSKSVSGEIEGIVWADIEAFLRNPGEVLSQLRSKAADTEGSAERLLQDLEHVRSATLAKNVERKRVIELYARGRISNEDLDCQLDRLADEEKLLKDRTREMEGRQDSEAATALRLQSSERLLTELGERLDEPLEWTLKRQIVEALVDSIHVDPTSGGNEVTVLYRFGQTVPRRDRDSWRRPA